jgi:hypothetical protein
MICESFHNLSDCGPLLSNSYIDTVQLLLLISCIIETFLVEDCVQGYGSFAESKIEKN